MHTLVRDGGALREAHWYLVVFGVPIRHGNVHAWEQDFGLIRRPVGCDGPRRVHG